MNSDPFANHSPLGSMYLPMEVWPALFPLPPIIKRGRTLFFRVKQKTIAYQVSVEYGCIRRYWATETRHKYEMHVSWDEQRFRERARDMVRFGLVCRSTLRIARRFIAEAFLCDCLLLGSVLDSTDVFVDRVDNVPAQSTSSRALYYPYAGLITHLYNRLAVFLRVGLNETGYLEGETAWRGVVDEDNVVGIGDEVIAENAFRCKSSQLVSLCNLMLQRDHFQPVSTLIEYLGI